MYNFDITKKGYDTLQVDSYISKEIDSYKQCIQDKNVRLQELLHINNNLKKEIEQYKLREDNVNKALITAVEKSQEMELIVKKSYNIELERLRIWRDKWLNYANKCASNTNFVQNRGEIIGVLSSLEQELVDRINCGINLQCNEPLSEPKEQYQAELKRNGLENNANNEDVELDTDKEIEKILANPEFNNLIKSLGIA